MARNRDGSYHRVQVSDLAAPQQIRPAPIKRDIYHRPSKPVVDTSKYDNLVNALGIAKSLIGPLSSMAAKGEGEAKKAAADDMWRKWNVYLSSTEQPQVLEDIRSGKEPFSADPYIGAAVRKYHGMLEARNLSDVIDKEINEEKVPFGTQDFQPERYILEKAKPFVERLGGNKEVITSFRQGLEAIRKSVTEKHQVVRGKIQTQKIESMATDVMERAFEDGVAKGLNGVQIIDQIRAKIYPEIGPRMNGGSFDLRRGRLDELTLDFLEKKAEDPRFAGQAIEAIHANRTDPRTGQNLGSLSRVQRHKGHTDKIQKKALKTLGTLYENTFKQQLLQGDVQSLRDGRGTFFSDVKRPNDVPGQPEISVGAVTRRKQALERLSLEERMKAGSQTVVPSEIAIYVKNGQKHEQLASSLQGAVHGFLNIELDASNTEAKEQRGVRLQKIQEMAGFYSQMKQISPSTKNWVDKPTREFFENYEAALASGMANGDPATAAEIAHRIHNNQDKFDTTIKGPELEAGLRSLDSRFSGWFSKVGNYNEVTRSLREGAQRYMRAGGMGAKEAITKAAEDLNKTTLTVNNRAIIGDPYLTKEDSPHLEKMVSVFYKQYEKYMKDLDLDEGDISVARDGEGDYVFVHNETGQPIIVPGEVPTIETMTPEQKAQLAQLGEEQANQEDFQIRGPRGFSTADVLRLRKEAEPDSKRLVDQAVKRRVERTEAKEVIRRDLLQKSLERRERELKKLNQQRQGN